MWTFLCIGILMSVISVVSLWSRLNADKIKTVPFIFSVVLPGIIGGVSMLIWWTLLIMDLGKNL